MNARSVLRRWTTAGNVSVGSKGRNVFHNAEALALRPGWPLMRGIITSASSKCMS